MQILKVNTLPNPYNIYISKSNSIDELITPYINNKTVVVITNETVEPIYFEIIRSKLSASNHCYKIVLQDGEQFKSVDTINIIYDELMKNSVNRDCVIVALGGGVVGDMAGFAAASFMRGVDFIQIPTTLLSQVDSSVGGKTGVNHKLGKNMIGAFKQPKAVFIETDTLKTLPDREVRAGVAEIIKYALISDYDFFCWLEDNIEKLVALDDDALGYAIFKSCEHKSIIVSQDELEKGKRALLNFGHTFGHAIENHLGYGKLLHGEAVGIGMIQASYMSFISGLIDKSSFSRIFSLINRSGLPVIAPNINYDTYIDLMSRDKKAQSGNIRFILLRNIGEAFITNNYDESILEKVLNKREFDL